MPKLSEAEKEQRRERVLAGARRCFAQYGYEGATVVRLEAEIGLSRGAIFNWFPSKEALFIELARRDNERLLRVMASDGLEPIFREIAETTDPAWLAVIVEFGRRMRVDAELRERWKTMTSDDVRQAALRWVDERRRSGELRDDLDADQIARFVGVVLDGIAVQRALGWDPPPTELLIRLVGDAISATPRPAGRPRRRARSATPERADP